MSHKSNKADESLNLRLSAEVKKKLQKWADRQKLSLSAYVKKTLTHHIEAQEQPPTPSIASVPLTPAERKTNLILALLLLIGLIGYGIYSLIERMKNHQKTKWIAN
jgi:hypothetical protein